MELPTQFAVWELCEENTRVFTVYGRVNNQIHPSIIPYDRQFVYGRIIVNNAQPRFGTLEIELKQQPPFTLAYCITPHEIRTMIQPSHTLPIVIFGETFSYTQTRPTSMYTIEAVDGDDEDYKAMFMNLYKKTLHLSMYY